MRPPRPDLAVGCGGDTTETIPATFEVLDDRFDTCHGDSRLERLYSGCRWAEGPVYVASGRSTRRAG